MPERIKWRCKYQVANLETKFWTFSIFQKIQTSEADFLNFPGNAETVAKHSDTLLVGDMFYDEIIGDSITALALEFLRLSRDNIVLIGDPGRWFLESEKKRQELPLRCLAKYELPLSVRKENNGLNNGYVYRLVQVWRMKSSKISESRI